MFVAVFARSYAVTDLRGYDKAAIKEVVNAAAGPAGGRGRGWEVEGKIQPFKKAPGATPREIG